jgi:hypothetical protein
MLASARSAPAQHDALISRPSIAADLLRPSAKEASPCVRTSDALCRATAPEARTPLLTPKPGAPCSVLRHRKRRFRRARPDRITACLRRQPRPDQCAFHRIDPNLAARAGMTAFAFTRTQPCPAPLSPATIRARPVKDRVVASGYLAPPWFGLATGPGESNEEDASHRLLQPTYDTSTLRSDRFSSTPPSNLAALRSALPRLRPKPPTVPRVELRLTATLQLRHCPDLPRCPTTAEARGSCGKGVSLVPGGCRDRRPLRATPPGRGVFDRVPSS